MFFSPDTFRKCTPYNQKVYTTRECTVYTGETLYLCNHKYNPRRCLFVICLLHSWMLTTTYIFVMYAKGGCTRLQIFNNHNNISHKI